MRKICAIGYWRVPGLLREVAERFDVSQSYVPRARARRQRLGQISAGVQCNHVPPRLAALKAPPLAQVALAPEQTLVQLCQWMLAEHGTRVGPTTMGKTLARLGLTLKKRRFMPASSSAQARRDWKAEQPSMDAGRLIFLDETWATTSMAPTTWGRAPRGERCVGYALQGHWHTGVGVDPFPRTH